MGGRCAGRHITDPKNTKMEKTSIKQRKMKASFEGDQGPKGAVAS
jgi:hypothetical protein